MDTLICPSCGKENPLWATSCNHCQSPLKVSSSSSQEVSAWLDGLDGGEKPPAGGDKSGASSPEWLKRIRQRSQDENEGKSLGTPPTPPSGSDVPDWVKELEKDTGELKSGAWLDKKMRALDKTRKGTEAVLEIKPAVDDWSTHDKDDTEDFLKKLSSWSDSTPASDEAQPKEKGGEEKTEDWLKKLEKWQDPVTPSQPAENIPQPVQKLPVTPAEPAAPPVQDWLSNLPEGAEGSGEDSSGVTDWLNQLQQMQEPDEEEEIIPLGPPPTPDMSVQPAAEELPDWLRTYQPPAQPSEEQPPSPAPAEELPDWLRDYQPGETPPAGEAVVSEPTAEVPPVVEPTMELPDWMSSLQPTEPAAALPAAEEPLAAESAVELPDWMSSLQPAEPVATPPAAEEIPAAESAVELPDWMSSLQPTEPAAAPPAAEEIPAAESAVELPDWMSSLQPAEPAAAPSTAEEIPAAEPAVELPDWMSSLRPAEPAAAPSTAEEIPAAEPAVELPDWMSSLQPAEPVTAPSTAEEIPAAEPAVELPDWMSSLQPAEPVTAPPAAEETLAAEPAVELPDWMSSLQPAEPVTAPPAAEEIPAAEPAVELPDWMSSLQPAEPVTAPPAAEETLAAEPAVELPDWMSSLQPAEPVTAPPAAEEIPAAEPAVELPDWMSSLRPAEPVTAPSTAEEIPAAEPAVELPDWMSSLQPAEPAAAPSTAEEIPAAEPAVELPDWMSSLQPAEPVTAPPAAEETLAAEPAVELPDWMSSLQPAEPVTAPPAAEEISTAEPAVELPDWMKDFQQAGVSEEETAPSQPAVEAAATVAAASDEGDWLGKSDQEFVAETPPQKPEEEIPLPKSVTDWLTRAPVKTREDKGKMREDKEPDAVPAENVPNWVIIPDEKAPSPKPVAEIKPPAPVIPEKAEVPSTVSPFAGDGALDWLSETQSAGEETATIPAAKSALVEEPVLDQAEMSAPFGANVPDWLATADKERAADTEEKPPVEPAGQGLEEAQLPGWLQAMRPVEALAPVETVPYNEDRVEKSGPLAGLRGILPGENVPLQYRKPPVYSVKLRVTDTNRQKASAFENLVKTETQAQPLPTEVTKVPQRIVRFIVGVVLIFSLLLPLLMDSSATLPAELTSAASPAGKFNSQVNQLTSGTVLVVVDYDPGFSGELVVSSLPVIQHLLERPVNIALVSTIPSGPLLAEDLLAHASSDASLINLRTANLGYLPGGVTSIREFASDPRQAIRFPMRTSDRQHWNNAVLNKINRLADFSQIIILTESLDTARAWVEQTQGYLDSDTALLIVSSAQIAPLVQPYVESGQVKGLIAGLAGGAAYGQIQQPNLITTANTYWLSYQLGMLAGILIVLFGATLQGILSALTRRKQPKEV